ncbi:MAG: substrate-binding domain-containing protein [Chloroflexota bacterium]
MAATAEATAMAYNGSQPIGAPDLAGRPITLIDMPKQLNLNYFASIRRGEQDAAAELGNVTVINDGPNEADSGAQINLISDYISRGVNGVLFSAIDPSAIAPVLHRGFNTGIHVVGYNTDSTPDAREWFVRQTSFNGMGKALMDNMERSIGSSGAFAIITSTLTTATTARYIAEMQAYQEKCFPEMKWLETVEGQADRDLPKQLTFALISKYGDQLQGLFGLTAIATPAEAEAVLTSGRCGFVTVVGLAMPVMINPYVAAGCMKSAVLWNPVDLGYAAVYVMRAVVDGTLKPGATSVQAGRLGTLQIANGSDILLGAPFIFTQDNINNFDF